MMDNATFRENMNAVAVAASNVSTQANKAQEPVCCRESNAI